MTAVRRREIRAMQRRAGRKTRRVSVSSRSASVVSAIASTTSPHGPRGEPRQVRLRVQSLGKRPSERLLLELVPRYEADRSSRARTGKPAARTAHGLSKTLCSIDSIHSCPN